MQGRSGSTGPVCPGDVHGAAVVREYGIRIQKAFELLEMELGDG